MLAANPLLKRFIFSAYGLFILGFAVSAFLYPGGSSVNPESIGFSFWDNYWCDLIRSETKGGHFHSGYSIALIGLLFMAIGTAAFWYAVSNRFSPQNWKHKAIRIAGVSAVGFLFLLPTSWHNSAINSASILSLISIVLLFIELYRANKKREFYWGLVFLSSFLFTFYIYQTDSWNHILPFTQKIILLPFFWWIYLVLKDETSLSR